MKTIYLPPTYIIPNGSVISWSSPATDFDSDIQKLISKLDLIRIECGNHNYAFNLLPIHHASLPFAFHETNLLMQLVPGESDSFYLKAALREFMNAFIVFNSKGDRAYPEDII